MLRVIFVFKAYFGYSNYRTQFCKKICNEHRFYPGNWFILKLKLVRQPVITVMSLFVASVIIFSMLFLIFETEYIMTASLESIDRPVFTSIYFTMVTLSTIGYGDYSPSSLEGRIVIMMASIWGAILLSLFVTVVSGLFDMSSDEQKAIELVDISREAVKVIFKAFSYHKTKRKYYLQFKIVNPSFQSDFMSSIRINDS